MQRFKEKTENLEKNSDTTNTQCRVCYSNSNKMPPPPQSNKKLKTSTIDNTMSQTISTAPCINVNFHSNDDLTCILFKNQHDTSLDPEISLDHDFSLDPDALDPNKFLR